MLTKEKLPREGGLKKAGLDNPCLSPTSERETGGVVIRGRKKKKKNRIELVKGAQEGPALGRYFKINQT